MDLHRKLRILGIVSIFIGTVTVLLCLSNIRGLIISIPLGFVGMLCSGIYVFVDTRNEINTRKITAGIIGMFLSSVPVLFILTLMLIRRYTNS